MDANRGLKLNLLFSYASKTQFPSVITFDKGELILILLPVRVNWWF